MLKKKKKKKRNNNREQVHEERLNLFHFDRERRGLRGNIIEVYKIMSDMIKVEVSREGSRAQG